MSLIFETLDDPGKQISHTKETSSLHVCWLAESLRLKPIHHSSKESSPRSLVIHWSSTLDHLLLSQEYVPIFKKDCEIFQQAFNYPPPRWLAFEYREHKLIAWLTHCITRWSTFLHPLITWLTHCITWWSKSCTHWSHDWHIVSRDKVNSTHIGCR